MISQSHRELRNLIHRVVEHFALFIMITVSMQLMAMAYDVYGIYCYVKTYGLTRTIDILFVTSFGILLSISVTILAIISNVCGSVSYEVIKVSLKKIFVLRRFLRGKQKILLERYRIFVFTG